MPAGPTTSGSSSSVTVSGTPNQNLAQVGGNNILTGRAGQLIAGIGDASTTNALKIDSNGSLQALLEGANGSALLPNAAALADALANPTTTQIAALGFGFDGATWNRIRRAKVFKEVKAVAVTAGTPVGIWTPAGGKKFRLQGFLLSLSVAGFVIFEDTTGAGNEFWRTCAMAAGIGVPAPELDDGFLSAAANNQLFLDVSASGTLNGFVWGNEE